MFLQIVLVDGKEVHLTLISRGFFHWVISFVFQSAPTGHKHLTVEELFGTSLPKEQPAVVGLDPEEVEKLPGDASQKEPSSFLPFSFEQPGGTPHSENLGVHATTHHTVQSEVTTPVLITPASITQSSEKHAPSYTIPLSPVLSPTLPAEAPTAQVPPSLPRNSTMMQAVKTTPRQRSPLLNQPVPELSHTSLIASQSPFRAPLSITNTTGTALPSVDLLQKLRLTSQHDQIQTQPLGKGAIAPSFSAASGQLATPESFIDPSSKTAAARAAASASLSNMVLAPLQVVAGALGHMGVFIGWDETTEALGFVLGVVCFGFFCFVFWYQGLNPGTLDH